MVEQVLGGEKLFEIGDSVTIKRSNGQLKEVTLKEIDYEKRMVKVVWQESKSPSDTNSFFKDIGFTEMMSLNRSKRFKKSNTNSELKSSLQEAAIKKPSNTKFSPYRTKDKVTAKKSVSGSPQSSVNDLIERSKSSAANARPVSKASSPVPPKRPSLQRSLSNIELTDELTVPEISKKRQAIKQAKVRYSLAPREAMAAKKNTKGPLKPSIRPKTNAFNPGRNAIMKASALKKYIQLIEDEKENLNIKEIRHRRKVNYDRLTVAVRKRPINEAEAYLKSPDIVSLISDDTVVVHECKEKVDLTHYLVENVFKFDYAFNEFENNQSVYRYTVQPLLDSFFAGGNCACFVYGQTGSGKTYTIYGDAEQNVLGMANLLIDDILKKVDPNVNVFANLFEIYSSKIHDLLNNKNALKLLEDSSGKSNIRGLFDLKIDNMEETIQKLREGSQLRSLGKTSVNENSSRSHAVLQFIIKENNRKAKQIGKFSLIDLAGNERGADNINMDNGTRQESSDINKNLLSLKSCIRALDKGGHVPFRECLLTKVLKDCFVGENCKSCMIAHVAPTLSSMEYTLNTLRYTSQVKDISSKGDNQKLDHSELDANFTEQHYESRPVERIPLIKNVEEKIADASIIEVSNEVNEQQQINQCDASEPDMIPQYFDEFNSTTAEFFKKLAERSNRALTVVEDNNLENSHVTLPKISQVCFEIGNACQDILSNVKILQGLCERNPKN